MVLLGPEKPTPRQTAPAMCQLGLMSGPLCCSLSGHLGCWGPSRGQGVGDEPGEYLRVGLQPGETLRAWARTDPEPLPHLSRGSWDTG